MLHDLWHRIELDLLIGVPLLLVAAVFMAPQVLVNSKKVERKLQQYEQQDQA